jgi:predicted adenylyl cyclase CyaB
LLYVAGKTRIHIDEVEGLGTFLELEVVLGDGESEAKGARIADDLLHRLGIPKADRVEGAYVDLIEGAREG